MITKKDIKEMAIEIMDFLIKNSLDEGVAIYFNDKRITTEKKDDYREMVEDEIGDPHKYLEYCAYEHILSMSFGGDLCDIFNGYLYNSKVMEGLEKIFTAYGLYYELGDSWNLTLIPIDNINDYEYTDYSESKKETPIYIYHGDCPYPIFDYILNKWYNMSKDIGDYGSCVIGAGFEFTYRGKRYFMHAASPYQGSISWEASKDKIEEELWNVGCVDINYNWGRLD